MNKKNYRQYYHHLYKKQQRKKRYKKRTLKWLSAVAFLVLLCIFGCFFVKTFSQDGISADVVKKEGTFVTIESALKYLESNLLDKSTNSMQIGSRIRVVIMTDGYSGIYHNGVQLCATTDYTITSGDETIAVQAGTGFNIKMDSECWKEDKIHIETAQNGEIVLQSIKRNRGNPSYEGSMDIYRTEQGMVIVNELTVEQYLYRVVPSEMPESYGLEALKAQAVCARSYACRQMQNPGYPEYDADVDDSVSYQVYNNCDKNVISVQAVNETCGQVATYQNEIIDAYFFSTSCGHTTDWNVWGEGPCKEYLTGILLDSNKESLNLTDEKSFEDFLCDTQKDNYDKQEGWYRWTAVLDLQNLSEEWKKKLGEIKSISVVQRGTGGVANCLEVVGGKETTDISTEYDIRSFLAPAVKKVTKQDGNVITNVKLLPSGYFFIKEASLPTVILYGGGYGHGSGLSQNAAKNMAAGGMKYDEILKYFYKGIELCEVCYI